VENNWGSGIGGETGRMNCDKGWQMKFSRASWVSSLCLSYVNLEAHSVILIRLTVLYNKYIKELGKHFQWLQPVNNQVEMDNHVAGSNSPSVPTVWDNQRSELHPGIYNQNLTACSLSFAHVFYFFYSCAGLFALSFSAYLYIPNNFCFECFFRMLS